MAPNSSILKALRTLLFVLLPLVAAGIPPIVIAATVARYGLNVPVLDQWAFVPLLSQATEGRLRFDLLWAQHNEHRIVLPRLIMLALARATDWDIRYELAANVVLALGLLAVLVHLVWRTVRPLIPSLIPWLILAYSLMVFSLAQWENWLWGWQLQIFMNALAAVVAVWALACLGPRWPRLVFALLAACAGTFSFGTGLVLMALLPLGLLMAPRFDQGAGHLKRVALAMGCGAGVVTLYLNGFHLTQGHPTPFFLFSQPLSYGYYVLVYVGAALGSWSEVAAASWGAIGIMAFARCSVWLWVRSPAHRHALLPWFLLALYAVISGFVTGIGRAGFGSQQALSSRYVTISSLFWVSLFVIVALAIAHFLESPTVSRTGAMATVAVTASLFTLGAVSYGVSWTHGETELKGRHAALLRSGECLLHYEQAPDECLRDLFPDVGIIRDYGHRLEILGLGPFAPSTRERPLSWYTLALPPPGRLTGPPYGATYLPSPLGIRAGETSTSRVRVTNTGTLIWQATNGFRLSYHWYQDNAPIVFEGVRTFLPPVEIAPGQSVLLEATVKAPPAPGTYTLKWDMVHEDITWFSWKGVPTRDQVVTVK